MTAGETESSRWAYVGVGCLTAVVGLAGGGMIAVLIAKAVGAMRGCTPDPNTGAPCDWTTFWGWGALIGLILVPTIAIWRMKRGRDRQAMAGRVGQQ